MSKGIGVTSTYTGADMWRVPAGPLTMSLREYYAGMAMQGLLSNVAVTNNMTESVARWTAMVAVEMADALIAALQEAEG